ncbi:cysteine rich repeat-containing protein [Chelatococcus asaccharovorans]|uniref:cysteine rich repeat-containing protein n=1 Tax=Chelatococcus asaccharovorans TaxID=28210 RepID=UPI00224C716B|nr:cysteine rich repeat-containing protein [Chelatococcus asaccharovorans]CAH1660910.1 conserved exported hypothetical protein [Chelatococcus asaccharovorans]CAH1690163.1 conserved exported hypothetical protein [Chelatococcus asaccharovorans]
MIRLLPAFATAFLLCSFAVNASAQTMSYAQAGALIARSCGPYIERYCSNDNIGGGRVLGCLQANQANVPQQCFADYNAVIASISARTAAQSGAYSACQQDIAQYCQGIQPGDGNLRNCLVASKDVVGGQCRQTLINAGWY